MSTFMNQEVRNLEKELKDKNVVIEELKHTIKVLTDKNGFFREFLIFSSQEIKKFHSTNCDCRICKYMEIL